MVEQVRFNKRKHTPKHSVETFIHDLYLIAEDFEYGTLKDLVIGDSIVIGVLDDTPSDRSLVKADLTLATTFV